MSTTNELYNVILTGKLLDNVERENAVSAFAKLFKLPVDKADAHFSKAPVIIKKSVDKNTAIKFTKALSQSGMHSTINPIKSESPTTAPSEPTEEKPDTSEEKTEFNPALQDLTQSMDTGETEAVTAEHKANNAEIPEQETVEAQPGFQFKMAGQPDYGFVTVQVPADQTIKVEASAMATMDTNMRMKTKMRGGFGRLLTGENIFINEFTAEGFDGEIGIAPGAPGDLRHQYLDGNTIYLQSSAFVACGPEVEIESKWQGLVKGFFSGESLFLIRAQGKGDLWFNSYGAIIEIDVSGDYVVDTGNIVGFTEGLDYDITKVGGYKSLFFSGEGFVCRFKGEGTVWIQTRGSAAFVSWAHYFRPVKKKG